MSLCNRFSIVITCCLAVICANTCAQGAETGKLPEARAVWMNADMLPVSLKDASELMERYAKANINVIFPEVICRGYSVYNSRLIGRDPRFAGKPDPLALLITQAHTRGIEVHPWVWVFRAGYTKDRGYILKTYPDWVERDKFGDDLSANGGLWISPAVPEAREYMLHVLSELVRSYNVDGLHLDYIRYESQSPTPYGYNPVSLSGFEKIYGLQADKIDRLTPKWSDWILYREDLVNSFVHTVSLRVKYLKPDAKLSVAVAPDISFARTTLLQNWRHWVNNGWVDFITPMAYFSDNYKLANAAKLALGTAGDQVPVSLGLGLHLFKNSPEMLAQQIDISRGLGCFGQALFAGSYISQDLLDSLQAGAYSSPAPLPFRNLSDNALNLVAAAASDPAMQIAAQHYAAYVSNESLPKSYSPPMAPPVEIPAEVIPTPVVHAAFCGQSITVDGSLDEDCWKNAQPVTIDYTAAGEPANGAAKVLTTWDDNNLYVAFIVDNIDPESLVGVVEKRDGPVFYDDSVEIFVDPKSTRRYYYHLSMNYKRVQFDQNIVKAMNVAWNGDWTNKSTIQGTTWTTEIAIPFASLESPVPAKGSSWYVNFTRNIPGKPKPAYLNWSVVYGSFHSPDRFGKIIFE